MSTTPVQSASPYVAQPEATSNGRVMGKEEFLRLLVTQLSNQDPLNPMNGHDFAAQLAQFSSVEQLINISRGMEAQAGMQHMLAQSFNSGVAAGLIGKQVEAQATGFTLREPGDVELRFSLSDRSAVTTVRVRDAAGQVILTREIKDLDSGEHDFKWDGRDSRGALVPAGTYSVEVAAESRDGTTVNAFAQLAGTVDRVTFGAEGILLWLGRTAVSLGAVRSVQGSP
jgi:flagellar basal-body rod modification protein FlgD